MGNLWAGRDFAWLNQWLLRIEYIVLIVYFGLLWAGTITPQQGTAAEQISRIVFAQFAGYFATVIVIGSLIDFIGDKRVAFVLFTLVVVGIGGFVLMIVLTDDLIIAGVWAISTFTGVLDRFEAVLVRAFFRGGWVMLAGFLSAFVGSMAGVDPDTLLSTDVGTVAGWGILYYVGLLLANELPPGDPSLEKDDGN